MRSAGIILVTGAFGNLGRRLVARLVEEGRAVRAFDLATTASRRAAAAAPRGVEPRLGDLVSRADVARAVDGVDGVLHFAGVLPPRSERKPALARAVNVEGTRLLVEAASARGAIPFVFASSVSVHGPSQRLRGLAGEHSPTEGTDHYTRSKLEAEAIVRASPLAWTILRIGASIEGSAAVTDTAILRLMFEIDASQPVELVHGEDVARAAVAALRTEGAWRRTLPVGGGGSCRLTQRSMMEASLRATGIGELPERAFGRAPYYTSWMDSEATEALLGYRRAGLDAILDDLDARVGGLAPLARLAAPLLRRALLRYSGPLRGRAPLPTLQALIDAGY